MREFADVARQEYLAVAIPSCLRPQIDLGTEPRRGRQLHTFGNDSAFVAEVAAAYVEGFQLSPDLGPTSVATMAKHFLGGGRSRAARTRTSRRGAGRSTRAVGSRTTWWRSARPSPRAPRP